MKRKLLLSAVVCLFSLFLFSIRTEAATSMGWDERYIEKYKEKAATYTVCFSFDETECWIRQIKLHPKKADTSVLKIPKNIKGAMVTRIGFPASEGNDYSSPAVNVFRVYDEADGDEFEAPFKPNNKCVRQIILPDTIEDILPGCFGGLTNLQKINLPKNLKVIRNEILTGCPKITKIKIPAKTEEMEEGAFAGCKSLRRIQISKKNKNYKIKNGVILTDNGTKTYVCCPQSSIIRIPKRVKVIQKGFYIFGDSRGISIPASVNKIEGGALNNTSGRMQITVSSKNKTYANAGKCIYNKKTGDLVYGAVENGIMKIPNQVTRLTPAVSWGGKISKIIIPASVLYMEEDWPCGMYCCSISKRTKVVFKSKNPPKTQIKPGQINSFVPSFSKIQVPKKSFQKYKQWLEDANTGSGEFLNGKYLL